LAFEYVKYFRALAGRSKKVLVTDLDNTLWGGILGEEGVHAIELGPSYPGNAFTAFQREIKQLSRRGIVLAINSKNNESDVREVFEKHPHMPLRWEDFAGVRVNWTDKVTNMRQLAEELSLGLDSFVFIDDSPAEIEIVQRELPEVTTIQVPREPAQLPGLLARLGYFDSVLYTEEDRRRGELYRSQVKRLELERSSTNLEAFYRSLNMRLIIQTVDDADVPRVAQLTQRTNQFNLTTRRYSEADVRRVRDSETHVLRAYRLEDRFGDNGIIAVTIVATDGTAARLDTFLMSCRVIGRTLETAILAELVRELQGRGLKTLIGEFLPTKKNAPAKDVLEKHGFARSEAELDGTLWELSLHDPSLRVPEWITVISAPARG
jgi:FkbH-like protein